MGKEQDDLPGRIEEKDRRRWLLDVFGSLPTAELARAQPEPSALVTEGAREAAAKAQLSIAAAGGCASTGALPTAEDKAKLAVTCRGEADYTFTVCVGKAGRVEWLDWQRVQPASERCPGW